MKTRAKWGSLKEQLSSMKPGDCLRESRWSRRRVVYCVAKRLGMRISIHQIGERSTKGAYGFIATVIE